MNDMTPTSERTGSEVLDAAVALMFSGKEDPAAFDKLMGRRGPSGKDVRTVQPSSAEKNAELHTAAKNEVPTAAELKSVNSRTFYKAFLTDQVHRLFSQHFDEEIYLPAAFLAVAVEQLALVAREETVAVKLVVHNSKPRLKVVALRIGSQTWTLAEAQATSKKLKASQPAKAVVAKQQTKGLSGKLKWFNPEKGFGFIIPADGGKDVFVHVSAVVQAGLEGKMDEDVHLSFDLKKGNDGRLNATNLKQVD